MLDLLKMILNISILSKQIKHSYWLLPIQLSLFHENDLSSIFYLILIALFHRLYYKPLSHLIGAGYFELFWCVSNPIRALDPT